MKRISEKADFISTGWTDEEWFSKVADIFRSAFYASAISTLFSVKVTRKSNLVADSL